MGTLAEIGIGIVVFLAIVGVAVGAILLWQRRSYTQKDRQRMARNWRIESGDLARGGDGHSSGGGGDGE